MNTLWTHLFGPAVRVGRRACAWRTLSLSGFASDLRTLHTHPWLVQVFNESLVEEIPPRGVKVCLRQLGLGQRTADGLTGLTRG